LDDVLRELQQLEVVGKKAAKEAVNRVTAKMVRAAKPLTPDDPGTQGALRDSVRQVRTTVSSKTGKVTGGIVAGGKELERRLGKRTYNAWALVQHEDATLRHPNGGQAKFLEQPFLEMVGQVPHLLVEALDRARLGTR